MKGRKLNKKKRRPFKSQTPSVSEQDPDMPTGDQSSFWNHGFFGWVYVKLFGKGEAPPTVTEEQEGNRSDVSSRKRYENGTTKPQRKADLGTSPNHNTSVEKYENGILTQLTSLPVDYDIQSRLTEQAFKETGMRNYEATNGDVIRSDKQNGIRHRAATKRRQVTIPDVVPVERERHSSKENHVSTTEETESRIPSLAAVEQKDEEVPCMTVKRRVMNSPSYNAGNLRGFVWFTFWTVFITVLLIVIVEAAIHGLQALCDIIEEEVYADISNQMFGLLSPETIKNWPSWARSEAIADMAYEGIADHFYNILSPGTIKKIHEWIRS